MRKLLAAIFAGLFALSVAAPVVAQDKKKEQVHKGTPEKGTVEKKAKQAKKDGSGEGKKTAKKGEGKKKDEMKK